MGGKTTASSFGGHRQLGGPQIVMPPSYLLTAVASGFRLPIGGGPQNGQSPKKFLVAAANWEAEATRSGSHNILQAKKSLGGSRRWLLKKSRGEKISAVNQLWVNVFALFGMLRCSGVCDWVVGLPSVWCGCVWFVYGSCIGRLPDF